MAEQSEHRWEASFDGGVLRSDRRSGTYQTYLPDMLADRPLRVDNDVMGAATSAERAVRGLAVGESAAGLEGLSRFLLRSEAIASSRIEGIAPSSRQVALAELADAEGFGGGCSDAARLVANNITVLRAAVDDLVAAPEVKVDDVEALQRALLPEERHHGLRRVQNWIGGSDHHPLGAEFVPPPPEHVRPLMEDLLAYLNGSVHAPLVQAAIVHAQFETIHPFTDGNGRVGRALIHTVLTRRGLTPSAVLPISLVLGTLSEAYVDGLASYRYLGSGDDAAAYEGVATWVRLFLGAATTAADQARDFSDQVAELRQGWDERTATHRSSQGLRPAPRAGSATARLTPLLVEVPVLTSTTARRVLGVSGPAARAALEELAEVGVLTRRQVGRGVRGYSADAVFDLITHAERRLASTRWDTRQSPPARAVAATPLRTDDVL